MARRSGKPVIVLANKAEGGAGMPGAYDAFSLGLGDPVPFSAEHGEGLADLFDALLPHVPSRRRRRTTTEDEERARESRSRSPSSAGPMPASRRSSTG